MNKWQFYVSRKFNYFIEWVQIYCTSKESFKRNFNFDFNIKNYLILNGDEYLYLPNQNKYNDFLRKKSRSDQRFFDKFIKCEFELAKEAELLTKELHEKKLSHLNNDQLLKIYQNFLKVYTSIFACAWVRPDDFLESELRSKLEKNFSQSQVNDLFSKIATYPELGELNYLEEPLQLLQIAKKIRDQKLSFQDKIAKKLVDNHFQKYQWLKNPNSYENLYFSREDFIARIKSFNEIDQKINNIQSTRIKNQRDYQDISKKLNKDLLKLAEIVRTFIFLRTFTTECADKLFYRAHRTILKEIAQRMAIGDEDIVALTDDEVVNFLENGKIVNTKEIEQRKKSFAITLINGKTQVYFGQKAKEILVKYQRVLSSGNEKDIKEIKGQVASSGHVKGIVKILKSYKENDKLKRGEILVVSMTTPDFISAMEKASAIITDEGGITCHAAIISRELGIPCIIGTKIATKVLRDGDYILVDANKGVITKLKDAK